MTEQETPLQQCPQCSAALEHIPGYVTWCEPCGWNANPQSVNRKRSLLDRLNKRLGPKTSERLLDSLHDDSAKSQRAWFHFGAGVFGALLLAGDAYLFYKGIRTLWGVHSPGTFFVGSLCLIFGLLLCPRLHRWKHRGLVRSEYPGLYRLLDEMAARMQARPVDTIQMGTEFNAFFTESDFTRKKLIYIGIPLFSILSLQEKIFVLAHEMAHNANRDMSRNWLNRYGQSTLSFIYDTIMPREYMREMLGPFFYLQKYVRQLVGALVFGVWYVYGLLGFRESQYAEYAADDLAYRISGTSAALGALEKPHYHETFYLTLERIARYGYNNDLFGELRKVMQQMPDKEQRRIRRMLDTEMARLDATHPPTSLRQRHVAALPNVELAMALTPEHIAELEREFAELERKAQRDLLERYRAYYL
ncbi:M48 family metallopeptidase [Paenibacillus athensensis]|nr:M48 family metallopeptidase [Paenibacillus athensensis]MCD1260611.1 M48 family metallopeptidase [Paenibacillus athensensis]